MRMRIPVLVPAVLVSLAGLPLLAQSVISARSGLIHYAEGRVFLGEQAVEPKLGQFPQMKEKDVLRSEEGRAEVLLNPGVFLRIGEDSSIRMLSSLLTDSRVELVTGSIVVEAAELDKDNSVTIGCGDYTISLLKSGLYRLDADPAELRVFDGEALVQADGQQVEVKKGKRLALDGTMVAQRFEKELTDSLDRWSRRRAEYIAMANVYAAKSISDSGRVWRSAGWGWNPYLGLFTFVPVSGIYQSPYGYRFWSPQRVYVVYEPPRPAPMPSGFGRWDAGRGYSTVSPTSAGTSGTLATGTSAPTTSGSSTSAPIPRQSGQAGGRER